MLATATTALARAVRAKGAARLALIAARDAACASGHTDETCRIVELADRLACDADIAEASARALVRELRQQQWED